MPDTGPFKAQYCWAHLIRDIRFLAEKHPDKKTKAWAEQLLERSRRLFSAWHRREEMSAEGFRRSMLTHRDRFLELVRQHPSTKEASNLAARFAIVEFPNHETAELESYDLSQDYFRFMFAEGIEPTNNHSEQQIRQYVIDRKITQGTRGLAGQRFHERMWTAIATCKKQNRNFFNFLLDSIVANWKWGSCTFANSRNSVTGYKSMNLKDISDTPNLIKKQELIRFVQICSIYSSGSIMLPT